MSCHSLPACRVSAERSAVNLMAIPLHVICCFSLAAFNIFSLNLIFDSLINMCVGMFLLGFILYGTLCASWTWLTISFPILGKFSTCLTWVLHCSVYQRTQKPWSTTCHQCSLLCCSGCAFCCVCFAKQKQWDSEVRARVAHSAVKLVTN